MTINSKQLYITIDQSFEEAKRQIAQAGIEPRNVYLTSWSGYNRGLHFKLEVQITYDLKADVEGTDLQEVVEEVIRRLSFQRRQETLLLAPTVEGTLASQTTSDADDIPF